MKKIALLLLSVLVLLPFATAQAAGDAKHPHSQEWSFTGMFGTYDKASMQRGLAVYRQVCSACHSLDRVYFRNLSALGYNEGQIKAIAAEYTVIDGPNDEGEMFERAAKPSDTFTGPYPNKQAAKASNGGAYPPDMSLLVKARHNGANYIHALLTGYSEAPHGHELLDGQYWNDYMPGHVIAMAAPLSDDIVEYEDGSPQTVEQYSKDVTHFLTWASDINMEERKRTGIKVLLFLIAFAGVMYAYKKRVWKDVH